MGSDTNTMSVVKRKQKTEGTKLSNCESGNRSFQQTTCSYKQSFKQNSRGRVLIDPLQILIYIHLLADLARKQNAVYDGEIIKTPSVIANN